MVDMMEELCLVRKVSFYNMFVWKVYACLINEPTRWPSPRVTHSSVVRVAQPIWEAMGSIPAGDSDVFFVMCS